MPPPQQQLPQRTLGATGLTASCLGLGCMSLTAGFYGPSSISEDDAIQLIRRAVELGV
jgi:aryl-alcohol dehydrogenase-like predicted oxidoreductase